ncbi:YscQ/HrcQ family type III secretion apparatus protein [Chromobacterium amazonense]|uniref:YscQ/HrcQ family type III secretion apparatus protein n=1 Tax=Chromobacterium amazonense TaxID=1382803 RepID=UPI003F7AC86E
MLQLKRINEAERALERAGEAWRQQGWDATLETPPRGGTWLPLADADRRWQGWMRPGDWLEHVAPELAGLAVSAGFDERVVQWLEAVEQPLALPMSELAYQRLWQGELVYGDALPAGPLLRVMSDNGPLWLERVPAVDAGEATFPADLAWPLRFVVGDSRVSQGLLGRVACGDVLLVREPASVVRCHDQTLGSYQIIEEGIAMEWQEQQDVQDEIVAVQQLGQLPVQLEFVLHRNRLTLAELRAMCQGQLLPLPVDAEQRVEVRANGALIGRGELVQLGSQLGVEVNEWLGGTGDVE